MQFHERQAVARKDDVPASSIAVAKPEPLVDHGADDFVHEPDCTYSMAPLGHVHFGCCSVDKVGKATFSGSGGDSGAADPAAAGAAPAAAGAPAADGAPAASGGSPSAGSTDSSGGGDNAAAGKPGDGDAKQQAANDKPAKVTSVKFTTSVGAPIPIEGKTYKEMYMAVSSRADLNKEGGKVTPAGPVVNVVYKSGTKKDDPEKKVDTCTVTIDLAISLPQWGGKSSVPAEDQQKFQAWSNSVKSHEDKHVAAFKAGVTAASITPAGDKESDIDAAIAAAFTANGGDQQGVDGSPPAPLAAPGGTEKVGANEGGAGDSKQAAAGAESQPPAGGDQAPPPSSGASAPSAGPASATA